MSGPGASCPGRSPPRRRSGLEASWIIQDGEIFAFEEFGVQDGSGFHFSTIYVIDTDTDSWAPGTPIRVRIDDETAPLSQAALSDPFNIMGDREVRASVTMRKEG